MHCIQITCVHGIRERSIPTRALYEILVYATMQCTSLNLTFHFQCKKPQKYLTQEGVHVTNNVAYYFLKQTFVLAVLAGSTQVFHSKQA